MKNIQCVDVIIPVFNGRDTIEAALDSVFTQNGNLINQVIVIDDGSIDDTVNVVERINNPNIHIIRTPNQGVSKARNLGIDKSTAEWIAFLDSDDIWLPNKIQLQIDLAHKYRAGFICCSLSDHSDLNSGVICSKTLALRNFIATSSVLVRRSVLQQIEPAFTPKMTFAEDYLAWLKCLQLTSGYYISEKLVDYKLSAFPRYNWSKIFLNIVLLNFEYSIFLRLIGLGWALRMQLMMHLIFGSFLSLISIFKRFFRAYFLR